MYCICVISPAWWVPWEAEGEEFHHRQERPEVPESAVREKTDRKWDLGAPWTDRDQGPQTHSSAEEGKNSIIYFIQLVIVKKGKNNMGWKLPCIQYTSCSNILVKTTIHCQYNTYLTFYHDLITLIWVTTADAAKSLDQSQLGTGQRKVWYVTKLFIDWGPGGRP